MAAFFVTKNMRTKNIAQKAPAKKVTPKATATEEDITKRKIPVCFFLSMADDEAFAQAALAAQRQLPQLLRTTARVYSIAVITEVLRSKKLDRLTVDLLPDPNSGQNMVLEFDYPVWREAYHQAQAHGVPVGDLCFRALHLATFGQTAKRTEKSPGIKKASPMTTGLPDEAAESVLATLAAKARTLAAQGKQERAHGIDDARLALHKAWSRHQEAERRTARR